MTHQESGNGTENRRPAPVYAHHQTDHPLRIHLARRAMVFKKGPQDPSLESSTRRWRPCRSRSPRQVDTTPSDIDRLATEVLAKNNRRCHPLPADCLSPTLDTYCKCANIDFSLRKRILCDHCRGSGAASDSDIHSCRGCGGSGVKITKHERGGRGTTIAKKCPHCKGEKVVEYTQHCTLDIEPGMPEGHDVVFDGEGDESPDWELGDTILCVRSKKEESGWQRKESTLYWRETIGMDEALHGFKRNITHLDGHVVEIDREGVIQPGYVQMFAEEGMPLLERSDTVTCL